LGIPEFTEIEAAVRTAIADFQAADRYLLEFDLNERTISHRFAVHLQQRFPGWDIDCEYNRHMDAVKSLHLPKDGISWDDSEAKTAFPDIIVHRRGPGPNLLVIEMKKMGLSPQFDYQKLKAYKSQVGYKYACLIWVGTGSADPRLEEPEWR
jgi:hypothetical protein